MADPGIVSLLFCGITLKHYAYYNMSLRTQRTTKYIFQTLASLSENFIFIYLGLSLFTGEHLVYRPMLILFTLVAVVASRYTAVFPIAYVLNRLAALRARRRARAGGASVLEAEYELPREYQLMLFWAGLRGAVGFALSAGIEGTNADALQTTVLVVVVLTVIVFGGTTAHMLDVLRIQTGVVDDEDDGSVCGEEPELHAWGASTPRAPTPGLRTRTTAAPRYQDGAWEPDTIADPNEVLPDHAAPPRADADVDEAEASGGVRDMFNHANLILQNGEWFQQIDERYLLPMFSNSVANRKHEQRKEQMQARRSTAREYPAEAHTPWPNVTVPYDPNDAAADAPVHKHH